MANDVTFKDAAGVTQTLATVFAGAGHNAAGMTSYADSGTRSSATTATLVSPSTPLPVTLASLPLPTGAATSALQTTGNTSLASIVAALASVPVTGTFFQSTQPVSASSLPLPTGASTAALQTTGNTSLSSILAALSSVAVTGTFFQATQPVSAASLPLPTGASSAANQSAGNTSLASLDTKTPSLGQALAAASVPVILPSATITTLTPPAAITGFALDATLTGGTQKSKLIDSGGTNVASVSSGGALKVDGSAATQPVSGTVTANQGTIAAQTPVGIAADKVFLGTTATTPLFAKFSASSTGNNTIVAADATHKIRVLSLTYVPSAAGNVQFQDGSSTVIGGPLPVAANAQYGGGFTVGLMETSANSAFVINLPAAMTVGGYLTYILV